MTGLNGRVARLERAIQPSATPDVCRACGLPHIRLPVSVALVGAIARHALGDTLERPPRLCLCTDCCAAGAHIARLTHDEPPGAPSWSV